MTKSRLTNSFTFLNFTTLGYMTMIAKLPWLKAA